MLDDLSLPNLDADLFDAPDLARVEGGERPVHPPRFLLLYGSLRERSYSRFLVLEAGRLLTRMGGEVRIFDPHGLPLAGRCRQGPPQGGRAARPLLVVGGPGLVQPRAARRGQRRAQEPDRLAAAGGGRRAADPGAHPGGDAGLGRLAVVQRGQRPARARPLDADGHHPQPVLGAQGLRAVRRGRPDEARPALRPRGRRDGGADEVHAAPARPHRLLPRPLQRAQGAGGQAGSWPRRQACATRAGSRPMHLLDQPTRFLFFTGKGGVGKTSVACAVAIALADAGKHGCCWSAPIPRRTSTRCWRSSSGRQRRAPVPGVPGPPAP